ncbi:MAG: glycerol-3-phosphate acyltransferase, partial [Clostridia bacterium]|nr:glycerol-3-phosphate acyltransferase [Clostridia bacterium]
YIAGQCVSDWAVGVYGAYICGIFCIIGHVFPLFFDFKGGKGVATGVGIYAVCCPIAIAVGLCVFAVLRLITKIVSVSSIVSVVVVVVLSFLLHNESALFWPQMLFSLIIGLIIILKHSDNIKRLISGEEKNFGFKR